MIGVSIFLVLLVTLSFWIHNYMRQVAEAEAKERHLIIVEMLRKSTYANKFGFVEYRNESHQFVGTKWFWAFDYGEGAYTNFIFVYSAEVAESFNHDDNTRIAWPSSFTLEIMEGINASDFDLFDFVDLSEYNFSLPLTVEDLVNYWNDVDTLFRNMGDRGQNPILNQAREIYASPYGSFGRNWRIGRWFHPGRLDTLNKLIEGYDLSAFDLIWPITEEDIYNNPQLIAVMARDVLTREELISIQPERLDSRLVN